MNVVELIEDYLCDKCDELFADEIVCDKLYNPEVAVNRAAFVTSVRDTVTDQDSVGEYTAQIIENRSKRSEGAADVELLRKNFTKYGDTLPNGLAIYVRLQYITMPTKIVVGTEYAYSVSANLNITVK